MAIVPVIDCGCRSVLALVVTKPQDAPAVLAAVCEALEGEFETPVTVPHGLKLRSDNGPHYTGADCEGLCHLWHLDHTFSPVGRPPGNAVAERLGEVRAAAWPPRSRSCRFRPRGRPGSEQWPFATVLSGAAGHGGRPRWPTVFRAPSEA